MLKLFTYIRGERVAGSDAKGEAIGEAVCPLPIGLVVEATIEQTTISLRELIPLLTRKLKELVTLRN
jgi:hypothetical protein